MRIVAKTLFGLEDILCSELENLGIQNIEKGNRAVSFDGDLESLYKCNLWLRTAIALLIPVTDFYFKDEKDLYRKFSKLEFTDYMDKEQTFAVKGAVSSTLFKHTQFPMLVLKDAIADYFRNKFGSRPSVDTQKPDIVFDVHIQENKCTVSLNSSGAPLFQRGYRRSTGLAPINEVVAAGLILLSGWKADCNFIDVFCGSGTIPIEAALIANGIPSNIARKSYAFQKWKNYDQELWEKIWNEAPKVPKRDLKIKIIGSDTDGDVILKARENIKSLPLGKTIEFEVKSYRDFVAPEAPGILISNPPYGERLDEIEIGDLYQDFGNYMKQNLPGYTCWLISSNLEAFKRIELKPSKKIQLFNGSLDCDFRKFEIFKGSLVEHKYGFSNQRREPKRNKKKDENI